MEVTWSLWPNTVLLPKVLPYAHLNQQGLHLKAWSSARKDGGWAITIVPNVCPRRIYYSYCMHLAKKLLSHCTVDVIINACEAFHLPLPSGVRCHSTRSLSTSWAAQRGVLQEDMICHLMGIARRPFGIHRAIVTFKHSFYSEDHSRSAIGYI